MRCLSVFGFLACLGAPNKLVAASTVYGKIYFHPDLLEPMIRPLSTRPRFAHQTSPNQTRKDKRRIKTIFNHFRDKPARYMNLQVGVYLPRVGATNGGLSAYEIILFHIDPPANSTGTATNQWHLVTIIALILGGILTAPILVKKASTGRRERLT